MTLTPLRHFRDGALAHEERVHRIVGRRRMRVEDTRQVRLRIEIDAQRAHPALRDAGKEVERGRRLAYAALLIENRDHRHQSASLQQALHSASSGLADPFAPLRRGKNAIMDGPCSRSR